MVTIHDIDRYRPAFAGKGDPTCAGVHLSSTQGPEEPTNLSSHSFHTVNIACSMCESPHDQSMLDANSQAFAHSVTIDDKDGNTLAKRE